MDETAFPPADLKAFLALCVGSWMSLRSRFDLKGPEDDWHTSDRGEVTVTLRDQGPERILTVQPAEAAASQLCFAADGDLVVAADGAERSGDREERPRQGEPVDARREAEGKRERADDAHLCDRQQQRRYQELYLEQQFLNQSQPWLYL